MADIYRFAGVPLSPSIAAELIKSRLSGRVALKRADIIADVVQAHAQGGGLPCRTDVSATIKKALTALQATGESTNVSPGFWSFPGTTEESAADTGSAPLAQSNPTFALPDDTIVFGEGKEAVYLYFLSAYKQLAIERGEHFWECKVGRTAGDPLSRVLSQAATALPERPELALVLWTDASSDWERAIQGVLAARGRRVRSAMGAEWFKTSPAEVTEIIRWIDGAIDDAS